MSIVRIGGGLVVDEFEPEPDPFARFRADAVTAEELAEAERLTVLEVFEAAEPPGDLAVKTSDLPPARARLALFGAWIQALEKERSDLVGGRAALLERLGIPVMTEQAIADLEASDASGLLNWVKSGARAVLPSLAREREREQLQQKLAADSYEAGVARTTLAAAEDQIALLDKKLEVLARRKEDAAKKALIEHAEGQRAKYFTAIAKLEEALSPLLALASIVGDTRPDGLNTGDENYHRYFSDEPTYRTTLPSFGKRGNTSVDVDARRIAKEVVPWKKALAALLADPRAKLPAGV